MTKLISDILGTKEPDFSHLIERWEQLAGRPRVDIHLSNEILARARNVADEFGLDVDDTTNKEFYYALIKRGKDDSAKLENLLFTSSEDSPQVMANKVVRFMKTVLGNKTVWVIKPSVTKRLLKDTPPKKLMKLLGYRSIDSVIKRELPVYLMALGGRVDQAFQKKMVAHYKKLQPSDFDIRRVELSVLSDEKAQKLRKNGIVIDDLVVPVYETGSLLVIAPDKRSSGDALLLLSALLEGFRGLMMHSAYFKTLSVRPKFGQQLGETIEHGLSQVSQRMVGTGWSSLHQLISKSVDEHPEELGPHVQVDDMILPTLSTFAREIPELVFWDQNNHVVRHDDTGSVSFNLLDVMINDLNQLSYDQNLRLYAQARLWDELAARYMTHEPIKRVVVRLD